MKKIRITILLTILIALLANYQTRYYPAVANGTSMLPTMGITNFCIMQKTPPAKIKEGDAVEIHYRGHKLLHRITEINGKTVYTKGDNLDIEEKATINQVKGKLIWYTDFWNVFHTIIVIYVSLAFLIMLKLNIDINKIKKSKPGLHIGGIKIGGKNK